MHLNITKAKLIRSQLKTISCNLFNRLANCGEYLFQATSDEEMAQWVNAINQVAIQDEGAAGGAGRSQTLPEQGRKDEPKKRSFFTLKKK